MKAKPRPWNLIPKPRPAEWGIGMTICIAAISSDGIVMVSDTMISNEFYAVDRTTYKLYSFHNDWKGMFSGNDLSRVTTYNRAVYQHLQDAGHQTPARCAVPWIEEAVRHAWREEQKFRIEDLYLNRYQMTVEDFVSKGAESFGSQYQAMKYQIDETRLDFELLVCGYDTYVRPNILSISDPGVITHHTPYKFWAIGSGANAAINHFFSYGSTPYTLEPLDRVIYKCIAAKFAAELSPGVGKHTAVLILKSNGTVFTSSRSDDLRMAWEKYGKPTVNDECLAVVKAMSEQFSVFPSRPSDSEKSEDRQ